MADHFHQLDRRLRQELLAVDGATLIDHTGVVLAVGAILQIPGGDGWRSTCGSKSLGKLGLGIKVSQDGPIQGFRRDETNPAFLCYVRFSRQRWLPPRDSSMLFPSNLYLSIVQYFLPTKFRHLQTVVNSG